MVEAEKRLGKARAQVDRVRAVSASSPEEQDKWRRAFLAKNPRWRKKPEPKKKQVHQSTGPSRRGDVSRERSRSRGRSR